MIKIERITTPKETTEDARIARALVRDLSEAWSTDKAMALAIWCENHALDGAAVLLRAATDTAARASRDHLSKALNALEVALVPGRSREVAYDLETEPAEDDAEGADEGSSPSGAVHQLMRHTEALTKQLVETTEADKKILLVIVRAVREENSALKRAEFERIRAAQQLADSSFSRDIAIEKAKRDASRRAGEAGSGEGGRERAEYGAQTEIEAQAKVDSLVYAKVAAAGKNADKSAPLGVPCAHGCTGMEPCAACAASVQAGAMKSMLDAMHGIDARYLVTKRGALLEDEPGVGMTLHRIDALAAPVEFEIGTRVQIVKGSRAGLTATVRGATSDGRYLVSIGGNTHEDVYERDMLRAGEAPAQFPVPGSRFPVQDEDERASAKRPGPDCSIPQSSYFGWHAGQWRVGALPFDDLHHVHHAMEPLHPFIAAPLPARQTMIEVLGFPRTVIRACETLSVEVDIQALTRILDLTFPESILDSLLVHDVILGRDHLVSGDAVPARTFTKPRQADAKLRSALEKLACEATLAGYFHCRICGASDRSMKIPHKEDCALHDPYDTPFFENARTLQPGHTVKLVLENISCTAIDVSAGARCIVAIPS